MAKEGDMTNILLLLGGAAAAYYVLNNYGPNGAVSAGGPSYWQSWFGTSALAATTAAPAPSAPAPSPTPTAPTTGPNPPVMQATPPPSPPASITVATPPSYTGPNVYSLLQASAQSNAFIKAQGGQADAYQWATLWNGAAQPPIPNVNAIFYPNGVNAGTPNGPGLSSQGLPLLSLTAFLTALQSAGVQANGNWGVGLQGIIPLPSFNGGKRGFGGGFGGGFGKPN